jgi:uncharacterized protein
MFSATEIADFLACHHLTTLERSAAGGAIRKPFFADPGIDLLRTLGIQHEQAYLRDLRGRGLQVVEVPTDVPWSAATARTVDALQQGVDALYQATLLEGDWRGRADFLVRVNEPSALGAWSYEVVETKLARSTKARAVIQLCFYSDLLALIQGREPRWMHVVLGGYSEPERLQVSHYLAYFRKVKGEFEEAWRAARVTYPEPVEHCEVCAWLSICDDRWRQDDHLSLVAGITRNQRKALVGRQVDTVARLALLPLPPNPAIEGIGDTALVRIREQARVQVEGRDAGRLVHEPLEPFEASRGLAALPEPSPGDIFLDLEGDPYALDQEGLEYLIGTVTVNREPDAGAVYRALWSFDRAGEKEAFERLIADVMECRRQYPDMHVYHYASYEPTAIKRLAGRHGTCVDDVDQLLRAGAFLIFTES